jgi:hypothetical protein
MIGSYSTKERFPVEKKNTSKFNVWAAVHSYGQFAGSILCALKHSQIHHDLLISVNSNVPKKFLYIQHVVRK